MAKLVSYEFSDDKLYCKQSFSAWFGFLKWVRYAYRDEQFSLHWYDAENGELILGKFDPVVLIGKEVQKKKLQECKKVLDKRTKRVV